MDLKDSISREISSELFKRIKPTCVKLSEIALKHPSEFNPQSAELISTIKSLNDILQGHHKDSVERLGIYILNSNLADYIFFPLSNLLKQESLSDQVIASILDILAILITYAWVPNKKFEPELIDQLLPVILFLIKGPSSDIDQTVASKLSEFKISISHILEAVISNCGAGYFTQNLPKRLSMLGDIISVLLACIKSNVHKNSPEELDFMGKILSLIKSLSTDLITEDQLSRIFPGIISCLINYITSSNTVHYTIINSIVTTMAKIIRRVFNDSTLGIHYQEQATSIASLNQLWEPNDGKLERTIAKISIENNQGWLEANSKKLNISLNTLFKAIFIDKSKTNNLEAIVDSVLNLVKGIWCDCFWSLFNEVFPLSLDLLALAYQIKYSSYSVDVQSRHLKAEIDELLYLVPNVFQMNQDNVVSKVVSEKVGDMITNKLPLTLVSTSDDKILRLITSLRFHLIFFEKLPHSNDEMKSIVTMHLRTLAKSLVDADLFTSGKNKGNKKEFFKEYTQSVDVEDDNKLDDIQLPPYINASSVTKVGRKANTKADVATSLLNLAQKWSISDDSDHNQLQIFEESFDCVIEQELSSHLLFLRNLLSSNDELSTLEDLLLDQETTLDKGISLWIANEFVNGSAVRKATTIADEFLYFDTENEASNEAPDDDISYLLAYQSQELMERIEPNLESMVVVTTSTEEALKNKVNQKAYAIALSSIGILSNYLPKSDFKQHFLMSYLYPMFEALTLNSNPIIQGYAKNTVQVIAKNYYSGSLSELILDNLDYLIDSLSIKMTIPGSLTPALPGILLIVLKVSGIELLHTNQLNDVITQIFIIIDSYHGYSILVEGYLVVFKELVAQIKREYLKSSSSKQIEGSDSLYKPWGMTSMEQVSALVSDVGKLVDPFSGYDREKEYFHRKSDTPFADVDSDDEDAVEPPQEAKDEEEWKCIIPKNIYMICQRMFIYSLRLLSHPSESLRIQLLKLLIDLYPILSTKYELLLPLVAQNWADILSVCSTESSAMDEVKACGFELLAVMIETDRAKNDTFLSKRFVDLCNDVLDLFQATRVSSSVVKVLEFKRSSGVNLLKAFQKYLIVGLNNYERIIPDSTALKIMRVVLHLGKPEVTLGKQARNIAWVLRSQS